MMFRRKYIVILDEDYQQIFKPFYYVQYVYCAQPFNVKQNYATPITKFNIMPAVIVNILIVVLFYATVKNANFWDESVKRIYFWIYSQYVQCFTLVTFLNFYQNKTHFMLLEKLQNINRCIKNTEDTKRLKKMSWTCCSMVVMFYVVLIVLKLMVDKYWHWTRGVFLMTTILFEVKLANVGVILYFLVLKLRKWQGIVLGHCIMGFEANKEKLNDLKSTFQSIISTFSLFKKTFQTIVSNWIIILFVFIEQNLQPRLIIKNRKFLLS